MSAYPTLASTTALIEIREQLEIRSWTVEVSERRAFNYLRRRFLRHCQRRGRPVAPSLQFAATQQSGRYQSDSGSDRRVRETSKMTHLGHRPIKIAALQRDL
jgi:hypothetical protein